MFSGWKVVLRPAHFLPQGDAAAPQPLCSLAPGVAGGPRCGPAPLGIRQPKALIEKGFSPEPRSTCKIVASCGCRGKQNPC